MTVDMLGTFNNCIVHVDTTVLNETLLGKVRQINPPNCNFSSFYPHRVPRRNAVQNCAFSRDYFSHLKIHHLSHQNPSKTRLCRSQDSISADDEYRSSRNIAISLFRRYRSFVERGGGDHLKVYLMSYFFTLSKINSFLSSA